MSMKKRSMQEVVEEQIKRWKAMQPKKESSEKAVTIVTVSREPGSGGRIIAEKLAEKLNFDLFHQNFVSKMANDSNISTSLFETLDEKGLSVLEEWIKSWINRQHLWPDQYLKHIMKIIGTIGKHGHAVIVGRGTNFILPPENRFRIRVIASMDTRIKNLCDKFEIPKDEARKRINRTSAERKAFVRKYFNADITAPINYDLLINMDYISINGAVTTAYNGIKNFYDN